MKSCDGYAERSFCIKNCFLDAWKEKIQREEEEEEEGIEMKGRWTLCREGGPCVRIGF
jgi:hypothetical protein